MGLHRDCIAAVKNDMQTKIGLGEPTVSHLPPVFFGMAGCCIFCNQSKGIQFSYHPSLTNFGVTPP